MSDFDTASKSLSQLVWNMGLTISDQSTSAVLWKGLVTNGRHVRGVIQLITFLIDLARLRITWLVYKH